MSDSAIVAVREDPSSLQLLLEQRRAEARRLELQVARGEAGLRRAREEQALLQELHTVDEMRSVPKEHAPRDETANRLVAEDDSLAEIAALENELRHENRRTVELQDAAKITSRQMEEVEKGIEDLNKRTTLAKQATSGGTRDMGASSISDEWLMRKKRLTELHEEQNSVKALSTLLSERIERLTKDLEEPKERENELLAARETLREKSAQFENLLEQVKSMERLSKKKERLLDTASKKKNDDYKTLKLLEGDKKVLYGTLSKLRETNASNTKSILSLEVRLMQLQTKLDAINQFLQQVFDNAEAETEEMENVPKDATEVPLEQFDELCRQLEASRVKLMERESCLVAHDAKVEHLDKKTSILQNAIASRSASAQLEVKTKEKEFEALMSHVDYMKSEFEEEYTRLSNENAMMRAKLAQI